MIASDYGEDHLSSGIASVNDGRDESVQGIGDQFSLPFVEVVTSGKCRRDESEQDAAAPAHAQQGEKHASTISAVKRPSPPTYGSPFVLVGKGSHSVSSATLVLQEGSRIVPQLQNIVSTVNFGCRLNLEDIAKRARNAEYNPKRFAALIMRIRSPRTTGLIFNSGKMVCTGAKSVEQSRLAARKYARIVSKLGFPARFMDFKVQNMVASCDVGFRIRLEGLAMTHRDFTSYEPELFPGLVYRLVRPKIVLLVFVSGKIVLTGAKERSEIDEAFEKIYSILKAFQRAK